MREPTEQEIQLYIALWIVEERNLELFSAQRTAQGFESVARAAIVLVGVFWAPRGPFNLAHQKFCLIRQHRRFEPAHLLQRRLALCPGSCGVVHGKRDSDEQQFRNYGLASQCCTAEEIPSGNTQALRFKQAAFVEED